jgi:ribosomal protein S18 acetylase RimI-like enzyme
MAAVGEPDTSRDEVAAELGDPSIDLASDSLVVFTGEPRPQLLAYARVDDAQADRAYLDFYLDPELDDATYGSLGRWLLAWGLGRVEQLLRASKRESVAAVSGCYREERRQVLLLEGTGFTRERVYRRMRLTLGSRAARAELPAGVSVRSLDLTDGVERALAHRLSEEPFVEHHGYAPTSYEEFWVRNRADNPIVDPTAWWIAEVDGTPAGLLIGDESRVDVNGGYVRSLGVLPQFRGRGAAKALLHTAFDAYAARGRVSVSLGVDSENTTGATALYESVGMSEASTIAFYARTVRV